MTEWRIGWMVPPPDLIRPVECLTQNLFTSAPYMCQVAAEAAFYLFADISDRLNDSVAFCTRMLNEAGVACSPGVDFDRGLGNRFVRFSYRGPEADMQTAAERLKAWR